jgi:hypothetical protein
MMTVVGEEGTSLEDFTVALKADFFDNCLPAAECLRRGRRGHAAERQQFVFDKVLEVIDLQLDLPGQEPGPAGDRQRHRPVQELELRGQRQ